MDIYNTLSLPTNLFLGRNNRSHTSDEWTYGTCHGLLRN